MQVGKILQLRNHVNVKDHASGKTWNVWRTTVKIPLPKLQKNTTYIQDCNRRTETHKRPTVYKRSTRRHPPKYANLINNFSPPQSRLDFVLSLLWFIHELSFSVMAGPNLYKQEGQRLSSLPLPSTVIAIPMVSQGGWWWLEVMIYRSN